jgi:heptosyltransferase-3
MEVNGDILELLRAETAEAARNAQRAIIMQPGAIGDCILTLPLASFVKDALQLGGIDLLGHTEYTSIFPGRTCIDCISSIDSLELHRLFTQAKKFNLADRDPLINFFAGYSWIATFLGEPGSDFEQNLIFTANCSHSAEVITLSLKPPGSFSEHLTEFYKSQFIMQSNLSLPGLDSRSEVCLIKATKADINQGKEMLEELGIICGAKLVIIQPGSGARNKCWHIDNYLAVAEGLRSKDIEVIFLLGPAERDRFGVATIKKISSTARCITDVSLPQVLKLLSCASSFIGNDSGITHLAAALGIRTLVVFGPTDPAVYRPIGPAVKIFVDNTEAFAVKQSADLQKELLETLLEATQQ